MPSKSWKNHLKKLLTLAEIPSFQKFSYSAQTAQMAEFMFQNVAYRATVYRTGHTTNFVFPIFATNFSQFSFHCSTEKILWEKLGKTRFVIWWWAKSLERSPAVGDFYGTRIEIWAGFGPVRQLLRPVFSCFHGQKKI